MKETTQQVNNNIQQIDNKKIDIEISKKSCCSKKHEYPQRPPNADIINPNLPSIDDEFKPITFNFINPLIKKI